MCRFVSWHSAEAVTRRIQLSCLSELLVKLEISLTLSGEIDNSNVKRVEELLSSSLTVSCLVSNATEQGRSQCMTE